MIASRVALFTSLGLHAGVLIFGSLVQAPASPAPPITVDLTLAGPFPGTGAAKLGARARAAPRAAPLHVPPSAVDPSVKVEPKAAGVDAGEAEGTAQVSGGAGSGANMGSPHATGDGGAPVEPPKLLNHSEILRNLRRFYPDSERRARREGRVLLAIEVGVDGRVAGVEILDSGGAVFDAAAENVARLMRFIPGRGASGAVAVKVAQQFIFQME